MSGNSQIIDLRSDTVTRPNDGMRQAMAAAEVGDDVMKDDPTVNKLEARMAELTGKEAALFVPSGTMGNLICVLSHCWERGAELLLGDKSHIHIYEQGGVAQLGGVHPRSLSNLPDGTFSLQELESKVREDDPHLPVTTLVAIENTHNKCGGVPLPLSWLQEVGATCKRLGLPLHCDGARIWNAAVSQGVSVAKLIEHCDSASLCLSKGLGCPVGSIIVGTKKLIDRAIRVRKVLGGGMRQAGILAAAGLYALDHQLDRMKEDHSNADMLADLINKIGQGKFVVENKGTNLVLFRCDTSVKPEEVVRRLGAGEVSVLCGTMSATQVRLALHCDVTSEMVLATAKKLETVIKSFL